MGTKKAMDFFVTTLLAFAMFSVLPIDGDVICPWCNRKMQNDLLECVRIDMISNPHLFLMPLQDIDNVKLKLVSDSDSMFALSFVDKKVAMDKKFVEAITGVIEQNNYQGNPAVIEEISQSAGSCYSSITGYDRNVVANDIKKMVNENIRKDDPNPMPNLWIPNPVNQNQQQPSYVNPVVPPESPPANSFNNPSYFNPGPIIPPGSPPSNTFNNPPNVNPGPSIPPGSPPTNSFNNPPNMNPGPFIPPGPPPASSFNYPSMNPGPVIPPRSPPASSFNNPSMNPGPVISPGSPPANSFNRPPYMNDGSFNPQMNSSSNPLANNNAGTSENRSPNNHEEKAKGESGFPNQAQESESSSSSSHRKGNKHHRNRNNIRTTTASPKLSTLSQDSTSSDSSGNSNWTTESQNTDNSQQKTTAKEKPEDEEPCDEKFKISLYDKLINDDRFCSFFGNISVSDTKTAIPEIMSHVFNEYGIPQHYSEFSTLWKFESKMLNQESKPKDLDELLAKICKIIFSRNNLLKEDCEETGKQIADYILAVLPGDPPDSSTQTPNQTDEDESNSRYTTNASTEADADSENSTNSGNSHTHESTEQDGDDIPSSETLTVSEEKQNLGKLYRAAESCLSPSGFDFDTFSSAMSNVTESIQTDHPNWSHEKCEHETYSFSVVVLAELLQDSTKSNSQSHSSSKQSDSAVNSSGSQNSNSDYQPNASNNNHYSDDSSYPGPETDYDSGSIPPSQQDSRNYRDYPNGPGPANIPSYENQPNPNWNPGLAQPSNLEPGPVNPNYENSQNPPFQVNQPYQPNRGPPDYGPAIPQPMSQNSPSDYSAIPPANMNIQPNAGNQPFPVNQNAGFQQSSNTGPNSRFVNSPNGNLGNNKFHPGDTMIPNGNTQPGLNPNSRFLNNAPFVPQQ